MNLSLREKHFTVSSIKKASDNTVVAYAGKDLRERTVVEDIVRSARAEAKRRGLEYRIT